MSFTSGIFYLFLVVLFFVYFMVPKKLQWIVLLIGSYVFYIAASPVTTLFLVATTVSVYFLGQFIGKVDDRYATQIADAGGNFTRDQKKTLRNETKRRKKILLIIGLLLNFGILFTLKYSDFFIASADVLLKSVSIDFTPPNLGLLLPLGISFYTFQSTGYLIDVFRGKVEPDKNLAQFALFVSFFPQIVQGPIGRYDELAHQLYEAHPFNYTNMKFGVQLILWGLFKKLVIADRVAVLVNTVFNNYLDYQGINLFFGALAYCIQIYGDFSGGIDIARGIAQVLGINLRENFKRPFFSTSIADFWRRWNISLSEWMRDYVFYSLSLSNAFSKLGKTSRRLLGSHWGKYIPIFLAQLITFLFVGIWHGANWTFVIYGLYNGFFIITEILTDQTKQRLYTQIKSNLLRFVWKFISVISTLFLVVIGRYFSRAPNIRIALSMLKRTFTRLFPLEISRSDFLNMGLNEKNLILLLVAIIVLLMVDVLNEKGLRLRERITEQHIVVRWAIYLLALFSVLIFGVYGIGYVATDFIYMGF